MTDEGRVVVMQVGIEGAAMVNSSRNRSQELMEVIL
jgi:hypothetical protein